MSNDGLPFINLSSQPVPELDIQEKKEIPVAQEQVPSSTTALPERKLTMADLHMVLGQFEGAADLNDPDVGTCWPVL